MVGAARLWTARHWSRALERGAEKGKRVFVKDDAQSWNRANEARRRLAARVGSSAARQASAKSNGQFRSMSQPFSFPFKSAYLRGRRVVLSKPALNPGSNWRA